LYSETGMALDILEYINSNFGIILVVLKYVGMAVAALSGILGLLVEFKDENKRITRHGKIALSLICISSAVAIGAQTVELLLKQQEQASEAEQRSKETLAAVQRTETVLFQIRRNLYVIHDAYFSYTVSMKGDHPALGSYDERLAKEALDDFSSGDPRLLRRSYENSITRYVEFKSDSTLFPDKDTERRAWQLVQPVRMLIEFYKTPPSLGEIFRPSSRPDWRVDFSKSSPSPRGKADFRIGYDVKEESISILVTDEHFYSNDTQQTDHIIAIPDLSLATMYVMLAPEVSYLGASAIDEAERNSLGRDIRDQMELGKLTLRIPGGFELQLTQDDFQQHSSDSGRPIFAYTIPNLTNTFGN
jgi:hypothetical protein